MQTDIPHLAVFWKKMSSKRLMLELLQLITKGTRVVEVVGRDSYQSPALASPILESGPFSLFSFQKKNHQSNREEEILNILGKRKTQTPSPETDRETFLLRNPAVSALAKTPAESGRT